MARVVDRVAALLGLVLLAPVMGVIALMVQLSSPGPTIVFVQRRCKDGTTIGICQFRTTDVDSSQVTEVGRFLRQSALNELPALLSLLRGDMTLKEYGDLIRR